MPLVRIEKLRGPLVFALAFAVGLSATAWALGHYAPGQSTTPPAGVRDPMSLFDPTVPLMPHGARTTLEEAAKMAGYPIYRPATAGEPSEVWVVDNGEGSVEVGVRYLDHGLVLLLAPWPPAKDEMTSLAASVADLPLAYTTTIDGNPASVLPYDPERALAPLDVVHLVVGGVEASLYGIHEKTGLDQVLAFAEAIQP